MRSKRRTHGALSRCAAQEMCATSHTAQAISKVGRERRRRWLNDKILRDMAGAMTAAGVTPDGCSQSQACAIMCSADLVALLGRPVLLRSSLCSCAAQTWTLCTSRRLLGSPLGPPDPQRCQPPRCRRSCPCGTCSATSVGLSQQC